MRAEENSYKTYYNFPHISRVILKRKHKNEKRIFFSEVRLDFNLFVLSWWAINSNFPCNWFWKFDRSIYLSYYLVGAASVPYVKTHFTQMQRTSPHGFQKCNVCHMRAWNCHSDRLVRHLTTQMFWFFYRSLIGIFDSIENDTRFIFIYET